MPVLPTSDLVATLTNAARLAKDVRDKAAEESAARSATAPEPTRASTEVPAPKASQVP